MKKRIALFSIAFLTFIFVANAQSSWGIKAGLNYNTTGKLKSFLNETESIIDNNGKGKSGFHVGLYGKLDLGGFYLRPELLYTKTTSEYSLNSGNEDYEISKLDIPVLIGFKLIGPINVFAGPSFQYNLENDFKGISADKIENDFSVGLHLGAGVEIGRFGVDVRYERGFNSNETEFIGDNISSDTYRLDSRPEQLMFGISYSFTPKKE